MRAPRFSIRALIFATALVAVDCALMVGMEGMTIGLAMGVFGSFTMLNILAVVCYRNLVRGTAKRPFFLGFATFGTIAVMLWAAWCVGSDAETVGDLAEWSFLATWELPCLEHIERMIPEDHPVLVMVYEEVVCFSFVFLLTGLPQLVIAYAGGWLAVGLATVRMRLGSRLPRERDVRKD